MTKLNVLRILLASMMFYINGIANAGLLIGVVGDGGGNGLVQFDKSDASITNLAALGNGSDGEGIAYNPINGLLYHTSGISNGSEFFETIDPNNGFSVGANLALSDTYGPADVQEISAIEWYDPLGVFIVMDRSQNWYHVTLGGAFSNVGSYNGNGSFDYMRGFAVMGTDVFSISPDSDDGFLERLDPLSGNVLETINYTVNGNAGRGGTALAYDADDDKIYGVVRGATGSARYLAAFDSLTNNFTTIGQVSSIAGLTVIADSVAVPAPGTFILFVSALLMLVLRVRRNGK